MNVGASNGAASERMSVPPVHPSHGYEARDASMCPGISISGITDIPLSAA